MAGTAGYAQLDAQETRMDLKSQQASEEVRKEAVPDMSGISKSTRLLSGSRPAHRALKLGSLATTTFDDVLDADISVAEVVSTPARRATRGTITTTVAV